MAKVTAHGKLNGHDIEAEVINPGDWFGKVWLIEVGCGYSSVFYAVEADHLTDALDVFVGSDIGKKQVGIPESDYGDYGYDVNPGDTIGGKEITAKGKMNLKGEFFAEGDEKGKYLTEPYTGSGGELADLDHVAYHGQEGVKLPWTCEYAVEGVEELVNPLEYGQPTYNLVRRQSLKEDGEVIRTGFKSDTEANQWAKEGIGKGELEGEEWEYDAVEVPCSYA